MIPDQRSVRIMSAVTGFRIRICYEPELETTGVQDLLHLKMSW